LNKNIEGKYKSGKNGMGQKQSIMRSIQRTGQEIGRGWRPSRGVREKEGNQRIKRSVQRTEARDRKRLEDNQRNKRGMQKTEAGDI
jgi:hypothetical protein